MNIARLTHAAPEPVFLTILFFSQISILLFPFVFLSCFASLYNHLLIAASR